MSRNERDRETSVVTLSSCGGVGATGDEIKLCIGQGGEISICEGLPQQMRHT